MDFVILKVNGKDVSNSSHEDAVRCFESAQEPIIVEVLRRQPGQKSVQNTVDSTNVDQDKPEKCDEEAGADNNPASSPLVSIAVQTDWAGLIEEELILDPINIIEEQPGNDSFEDFLPQHINFEEVTLRKSGSAEKLGLTVCYSSGSGSEDADTEVYISEIVPESLAARDGRLKEGDQILRVNGRDVANKEQTECLFAETKNAVTLLVSRCFFQDEEYDERHLYQQESPSSSPDNNPAYQNSMIEQLIKQQQENEEQTKELDGQKPSKPPVPSHTQVKECSKKLDAINLRPPAPPIRLVESYTSHVWSDTEHIYETIPESDSEPIYSSPYEHRQWVTQSQSQPNVGAKENSKPWNWSSKSNSSGEEKESSSAYNTGESCHSNPLTLELHQGEKDHHKSTLVLCQPQPKTPTQGSAKVGCSCPAQFKPKTQSSKKTSHHRDVASTLPADTMYTNAANLQQTILLQQELFKQALMTRRSNTQGRESSGARKSKSHGNFQAPNLTRYQFVGSQQVCTSTWVPPEDKCEVQMEWKVKRRPDGTRYIARRPVRNRILRNRAIKISEERAGHTTEDDTMSEMKVGRYWSKEERKRHLERAREKKQQQQQAQQAHQQIMTQIQSNEEICNDDKLIKKPLNIVDMTLSQKKITRKKTTIDDFTTVQEMLVHGNRVSSGNNTGPPNGGKHMGLLSVTTV